MSEILDEVRQNLIFVISLGDMEPILISYRNSSICFLLRFYITSNLLTFLAQPCVCVRLGALEAANVSPPADLGAEGATNQDFFSLCFCFRCPPESLARRTVAFMRSTHPSGAILQLARPSHPSHTPTCVSTLSLSAAIQHSPFLPPHPLSSPPLSDALPLCQ